MKYLPLIFCLSLPYAALAQTCNPAITADTPTTRFVLDNDKGTAFDSKTGLTWTRCALGQTWAKATKTCTGKPIVYTWKNALNAAENTVFAAHNNWRLPNVKELASIIERRCDSPSINAVVFPNTRYDGIGFWSSSQSFQYDYYSWHVLFYQGTALWRQQAYDKSYVRLVYGRN